MEFYSTSTQRVVQTMAKVLRLQLQANEWPSDEALHVHLVHQYLLVPSMNLISLSPGLGATVSSEEVILLFFLKLFHLPFPFAVFPLRDL